MSSRGPLIGYAPGTCRVCAHPRRDEIELLVYNDVEYSVIMDEFEGFTERTLKTHVAEHMNPSRKEIHGLVKAKLDAGFEVVKTTKEYKLSPLPEDILLYGQSRLVDAVEIISNVVQKTGSTRAADSLSKLLKSLLEFKSYADNHRDDAQTINVNFSIGEFTADLSDEELEERDRYFRGLNDKESESKT